MEDGSERYYKRKLSSSAPKTREIGVSDDERLKQERNVEFWKNRYGESAAKAKRLQEKLDETPKSQEDKPVDTKWSESYEKGEQVGSYERKKEPHELMSERYSSPLPERQPNESAVKRVIRMLAEKSMGYLRRNPEQIKIFEKEDEGVDVEQQRPPSPPLPPMPPGGFPPRPIGKPYVDMLKEMKSKEEGRKDNL